MELKKAVKYVIWYEGLSPLFEESEEFEEIFDDMLAKNKATVREDIVAVLDDSEIDFDAYAKVFEVDAEELRRALKKWLGISS